MKKLITLTSLLVVFSASAAFAATPEVVASLANACCDAVAACCQAAMACCN